MRLSREFKWLLLIGLLVAGGAAFLHHHPALRPHPLTVYGVQPGMTRDQIEKKYGKREAVPADKWSRYEDITTDSELEAVWVKYEGDLAVKVSGEQLEASGRPIFTRASGMEDHEKVLGPPSYVGLIDDEFLAARRYDNLQLTVIQHHSGYIFLLEPVSSCHRIPNSPRRSSGRHEILLEHVPARKVVGFLKEQFPEVQFTPHPTMNGFYASGSKKDILQLLSEMPNLDRIVVPFAPSQRRWFAPMHQYNE